MRAVIIHFIHIVHSLVVKNLSDICSQCKRPFYAAFTHLFTLEGNVVSKSVDNCCVAVEKEKQRAG